VRLSLEALEGRIVLSTFTAKTVSDLIADINAANKHGGSNSITLKAGQDFTLEGIDNTTDGPTGTPVITAKDNLTIVGNGALIERDYELNSNFRLFDVAAGASLTLQSMTLQDGLEIGQGASAEGAAIYNMGTLDLNHVTVQDNTARVQGGLTAAGGAVYSGGVLTLEGGTQVVYNSVVGSGGTTAGAAGGNALGGGVYVAGGSANLSGGTISTNTARGGAGHAGAGLSTREGGSIYIGPGGPGGNAEGGGLFVAAGTVTLTSMVFSSNTTMGGEGSPGSTYGNGGNGSGGAVYFAGGTATLRGVTATSNSAGAGLGFSSRTAGVALGGGFFIAPAAAVGLDTFTQRHVTGNTAAIDDPNIFGTWTAV